MTNVSPFEALTRDSRELEARARKVQGEDRLLASEDELDALISAYHAWFARALEVLPPEYHERFRFEFEGNLFQHRIKHFFESPGEPNPLYDPNNNLFQLSPWAHSFEAEFRAPLLRQRQILSEARQATEGEGGVRLYLDVLERLARGLPSFLVPMSNRYGGRPPLVLEDEYDLQDVFHGLLRMFFDDVRPEDFAPERAGGKSRVDFLLKAERIIVETKMTRQGLGAREVGDELIVDIERYRSHPDCAALVALVYDPEKRIQNRRTLESDLSGTRDGLVVRVLVVQ
jgi:hypothetical protein